MKRFFLIALLITSCIMVMEGSLAVASEQRTGNKDLRKGIFLIAVPKLLDPHFRRTVVLLIMYEKQGAIGLIINRPTGIPLSQALPNLKEIENLSASLFFGGPVSQNRSMILLRSDKPLDEAQEVFDNVYLTESRNTLAEALRNPNQEKNIRVYSGYAGWGPGQLDGEMARGDWLITDADPETIFSENTSEIWKELLKKGESIEVDRGQIFVNASMVW